MAFVILVLLFAALVISVTDFVSFAIDVNAISCSIVIIGFAIITAVNVIIRTVDKHAVSVVDIKTLGIVVVAITVANDDFILSAN